MASSFQLVIDCADPEPLAQFCAAALGYELEPPPAGFDSWDEYWRDVGVPENELGMGADCIIDPAGRGPRIVGVVHTEGLDHHGVAIKDPEGNEYDTN